MSDLKIINRALTLLGCRRLDALPATAAEGTTKEARMIVELYETTRDQMLSRFPFHSIVKRTSLVRLPQSMQWAEDEYAYALPEDFIALAHVRYLDDPYRIEQVGGRKVLVTSEATMDIRYMSKPDNADDLEVVLIAAVAARLAAELAYPLVHDKELAKMKRIDADDAERDAKAAIGQQEPKTEQMTATGWTHARRRGVARTPGWFRG